MALTGRTYSLLPHQVGEAYDAVRSAIRNAIFPRRYQPLPQDSLSTQRARLHLRPGKRLVYAVAGLLVLALFVVYSRGNRAAFLPAVTTPGSARAHVSKDQFIAAVLRDPVEGLLDPEPIRQKCEGTKFQEGLVWQCAAVNGGIGNVVNMVLNCVRYAIEAGATSLILPRIAARADNLVDLGGEDRSVEMSYLLDLPYFLDSWKLVCPQIQAVVSEAEIHNLSSATVVLSPSTVKTFQMRKYLIVDPTGWRDAFDVWMAKNDVFKSMSAEQPARVWQNLAFAQWNREAHSPEFAHSFPRLFRHPLQTRNLAASALWSLEKKIGRPAVSDTILFSATEPSQSSKVNSLGPDRLVSGSFLGAHLRVAADATAAGWPGYEAQAPLYLAEAKRLNVTTIYLATGSAENRERFREDAAREGLSVFVKEDLLEEEELVELQGLTWDQQALVDFDVLMHSTWFCGFVRSSFSWALALRRSILPEAGTAEWSTGEREYRDNLSAIVGRYGSINPEGLWT